MMLAVVQAFGQGTVKYEYDALNRLTQVTYGNGVTVNYTYDALGNRLSKKVTGSLVAISGDLNDDGKVDVTDVVKLINMVLSGSTDSAADINGDGTVDEKDVVKLSEMVLNRK
jgi:YD repeat-containing protein